MEAFSPPPLSRVLALGLVAALVMAVPMSLEAVDGEGFWAPMIYISGILLPEQQNVPAHPSFDAGPVLLGVLVHLVTSIALVGVFAWLAPRFTLGRTECTVVGIAFGATLMLAGWFLIFPWLNPVMLRLSAVLFFLSHLVWGATAGFGIAWISAVGDRASIRAPSKASL